MGEGEWVDGDGKHSSEEHCLYFYQDVGYSSMDICQNSSNWHNFSAFHSV